MSFSTQDSDEVLSEMNVTPLVDVMLYGRDFAPDGALRAFSFPVFNDSYNPWEQPAGLIHKSVRGSAHVT